MRFSGAGIKKKWEMWEEERKRDEDEKRGVEMRRGGRWRTTEKDGGGRGMRCAY